MIMKAV